MYVYHSHLSPMSFHIVFMSLVSFRNVNLDSSYFNHFECPCSCGINVTLKKNHLLASVINKFHSGKLSL